jgi:uncharacterized protein
MVEMTVDSVRISVGSQNRVVILKDTHEDRYLLIWIGQPEAQAIAQGLQGESSQRPLTHDLLFSAIKQMGGEILEIVINALKQAVYHAQIIVEINSRRIEIDARSSDAIALAVRAKCPIYAADSVIQEAAIYPEEMEKPSPPSASQPKKKKNTSANDNLSIYRDFINTLDSMDDLGSSE